MAVIRRDGSAKAWGGTASYASANVPDSLRHVVALDCGNYSTTCIVNDGSPAITVNPFQRWVEQGKAARFQVMVSGEGELSYQWQFNGMDIPMATNRIYSISKVSGIHAGEYRVIVRNAIGVATSKAARLNVLASLPPVITLELMRREGGDMLLHMDGLSGKKQLRIDGSTNLVDWDSSWITEPNGSTLDWIDPTFNTITGGVMRFYRVYEP